LEVLGQAAFQALPRAYRHRQLAALRYNSENAEKLTKVLL